MRCALVTDSSPPRARVVLPVREVAGRRLALLNREGDSLGTTGSCDLVAG